MTTDKTPATLATAKHGGCVQLGDQLPPLPKTGYVTGGDFGHEAHNAFTPEQMQEYARAAIAAALSAQPSPGGQGDGLVESLVQVMNAQYDGLGYLPADVLGVLNMAVEALADRQPVGNEPAFYLSAGAWRHIRIPMTPTRDVKAFRHGFDHGDTELVPFYTAPPAQAVDLGEFRKLAERLLQEGEDAADAHTNADHRYCARELLALIDSKEKPNG